MLFYCVAEHSCIVHDIVSPKNRLVALLHDATEAYVGDMIRPLKLQVPQFSEIELAVWLAVSAKFAFPEVLPEEVKWADSVALAIEKRDVMAKPVGLSWGSLPEIPAWVTSKAEGWSPLTARREFMSRYEALT